MLRSLSLPHVNLKRLKLIKQDSNLSDDSSSGFKDSGIDGGDDNLENRTSEIQADFPSLPSSGIIAPDFPSNGVNLNQGKKIKIHSKTELFLNVNNKSQLKRETCRQKKTLYANIYSLLFRFNLQ